MKSKFRKLFWIRLILGISLFIMLSLFLINELLNPSETKVLALIVVSVVLLFLGYLSLDLFKIFTLRISEKDIEQTFLITRSKKTISFNSISSVKNEKVVLRNARGNITNGYHITVVKFAKETLIISPDSFENYDEIVLKIKSQVNNQHAA